MEDALLEDGLPPLPDLPKPNFFAQRSEAATGSVIVLGIILACVEGTHGSLAFAEAVPLPISRLLLALIYAETAVALVCLCGILLADPGVIKRSPQTCLPVPDEVKEKLGKGEPLTGLINIRNADGRSYCMRCLVWRNNSEEPAAGRLARVCERVFALTDRPRPHHCRICGRCVRSFDHHCSVFGRCIAGAGYRGNVVYFLTLIAMAFAGMITCGASVIAGMVYTWEATDSSELPLPPLPFLFLAAVCCWQCLNAVSYLIRCFTPGLHLPGFASL